MVKKFNGLKSTNYYPNGLSNSQSKSEMDKYGFYKQLYKGVELGYEYTISKLLSKSFKYFTLKIMNWSPYSGCWPLKSGEWKIFGGFKN